MEKKNVIEICVRSLSTDVEKDWITPAEALEFMSLQNKKDGSEEFIIVDYDAPFTISEYDSISELVEIAEQLENLTDEEIEILEAVLEHHTNYFDEALNIVINGSYMIYNDCYNMYDVAVYYCTEAGILDSIPEEFQGYFDFAAFGRDMEFNGRFYQLNYNTYLEILR